VFENNDGEWSIVLQLFSQNGDSCHSFDIS
jgi:hypothetical protein